jgi:hypothetical protein
MTLPTGTISMSDVNVELGRAAGTKITLDDAIVRALAGGLGGTISLNNLRGKAANSKIRPTSLSTTYYISWPEWAYDSNPGTSAVGDLGPNGMMLTITGIPTNKAGKVYVVANIFNQGTWQEIGWDYDYDEPLMGYVGAGEAYIKYYFNGWRTIAVVADHPSVFVTYASDSQTFASGRTDVTISGQGYYLLTDVYWLAD